MNVSFQNIDKVSGLLTVKLEKADYQEKVDKSLQRRRRQEESGVGGLWCKDKYHPLSAETGCGSDPRSLEP